MRDESVARADRGAAALDELAERGVSPSTCESARGPQRIHVCSIADFLEMKFPPRENILEPWLPRQGLAMIHAKRGVGKTHVGLGVACAVASGGTFLPWKAGRPRGVLYLDGEMPASTIQQRLSALVAASDRELKAPLHIFTPDLQPHGVLNLADLADQHDLEPFLSDVELIIVDNLSCLVRGGSENEAESWQPVQDWALHQRSKGRSVVLLHHDGKGGLQRGTSKKEDVLDTVIQLRQPPDYGPDLGARFEVHYLKTRNFHGADAKPFEAALETDADGKATWTVRALEDSTRDRVVSLTRDGLTPGEVATELGVHKSTVSRALKDAKREGKL